jgi:AAA ATPase containing von Willebrand factor type A (vWA) domain
LKKPKFTEKIKTEAVVASFLLVFLIGCGLVFISGHENTADAPAIPSGSVAQTNPQPGNETPTTEGPTYAPSSQSGGYWYLVKIPGKILTSISGYYRTPSELSGTAVNAADQVSEIPESGSINIEQGENGELILVDDNGEIVDWNDLPEDVRADLIRLFPELFDDIQNQTPDDNETTENNETGNNETEEDPFDYPEAEEEDLNLSDIEQGDDNGFSDDFDDELNPDEDDDQNQTEENQTGNETPENGDDQDESNSTIDTGNDEVGQVEEVNPLEDEEEFPEEQPDDLPDEEWIDDWING